MVINQKKALELLQNNSYDVGQGAWNKLYHKTLFKNITFPPGYLYEDTGTTYKTILKSTKIYYLNETLYYYYLHSGNITTIRTKKALHDRIKLTLKQYHHLTEWNGCT